MRAPVIVAAAATIAVLTLAACPAPAPSSSTTPSVVVTTPPPPPPPAPPPPAADGVAPPVPGLRLPKTFAPKSYDVELAIDPAKPTFDGDIMITGEITERTSVIWLHGRHLKVTHGAAAHDDPFKVPTPPHSDITVTPHGDDLLELHVTPALDPGTWVVALEYTGEIDAEKPSGAFKETVGKDSYVYTQFEAIFARRVFPCVDEPDSKVPWKLSIDAPKGMLAVSNTPVAKTTPLADGRTRYQFAQTPPLPSYLIAFGVGPFDVVDAGATRRGIPVRILTMKGRAADAAWAAKTTPRILDLLEEWFAIPYPYDKADMLAVATGGFGAMENAGLVTFGETLILVDAHNPSWDDRYTYVTVAAHELAHQWFGDYVTTAWWDDLWLNEGFANWMERKITARFEPAWHNELGDIDMRNQALDADRLVTARKVRQPIEKVDDILDAFDAITYDKGASVLAMFESYVGAEAFQKGVRSYLQARAFGNATAADFVAAIDAASGKDVAPAFASFLDQPGAPELTATLACGKGAAHVELAQQRYVPPGAPVPATATTPWIVPVCVAYEHGGKRAEACTLLDKPTGTLALDTRSCPRWLLPNVNGRGYYRTKLTAAQVTALRDEAWPQLSWPERRALYFDVIAQVRSKAKAADKLPLALGLSFVPRFLAGGDRFTIGDSLHLPQGLDRFVADDQRPKYEAWLRLTFGPGAAKVGVLPKDTDDLDAEETRGDLFDATAWLGRDPDLVKQAVELAAHWRDLPAGMRPSILRVAADASPEVYAQVLATVKTEKDREHRNEMINALASTRDPKRLEGALALLLDPSIEFRDFLRLAYAGSTEVTRRTTETFVRDHKDALIARAPHDELGGSAAQLARVVTRACDPARRDEIADFVTKTFASLPHGGRVVKESIEGMDQCIATRQVLEPEVRAWLGGVKIPKPTTAKDKAKDRPKDKAKK